jgi:lipoprotein-releasing system permease protein
VKLQQRQLKIEDWSAWVPRLRSFDPGITGVSPMVDRQAFLIRAAKRKAVRVNGVVPEHFNAIVSIQSRLVAGRFFGLNAGEVVLGRKLADEFAIRLGDKVRLLSEEGNAESYTLAGIFESEFTSMDEGTLFIPLRDAQALFALGGAVTSIGLKLEQVYDANAIADRLALVVPYEVESWMRKYENILDALRTQDQSMALILGFSTVAAGFGIAAILITSVMSRLREIGILKAVGATRRQVLSLFAFEGVLVAAIGALIGEAAGVLLSLAAVRWWQAGVVARTGAPFQAEFRVELMLGAMALALVVGFLASLYPAWRAARVNPVEVIRGT